MYSLKFIYNNKGKDMNDRNSRAATLFKLVNGIFSATEDECKKYADANELLETHLKMVIQKVLFMNDRESYRRFIKLTVGGNR